MRRNGRNSKRKQKPQQTNNFFLQAQLFSFLIIFLPASRIKEILRERESTFINVVQWKKPKNDTQTIDTYREL